MRFGRRLLRHHEMAEILKGGVLPWIFRNQVGRRGKLTCQQRSDHFAADTAALLENDVVHPPFDLEKNGGVRAIFVVAEAEFVAVFIAVDRVLIEREFGGIEVQAVNRVGEVRQSCAKFINFEIRAHEIAHA